MSYTYDYPRPALTVDAVVFRKTTEHLEVLLIQRKNYPFAGMWALTGGFVEMEETVEEAVVRELEEETNLKVEGLKQLHTFSELGRNPRGRIISVTFYGTTSFENSKVTGSDDAADAKWFSINEIPRLAFDHIFAVQMAIEKI